MDFDIHAPTMYFPQLVAECMLIEPTETESLYSLDALVDALVEIRDEVMRDASSVHHAPYAQTVTRVDEVLAARNLELI